MATKKADLRKVKITKYDDGSGDYVTNGYFHQWVVQDSFTESGLKSNAYGLVELEDGKVRHYEPNRLKFVDTF